MQEQNGRTTKEMINEVVEELKKINEQGWIPTMRTGNTGIGFTLESHLGIEENNISDSDIDGVCELKAKRSNASSRITAFCLTPVWAVNARKLLEEYGYQSDDHADRTNLYAGLKFGVNKPPSGRYHFLVNIEEMEDESCVVIRDGQQKLIGHLPLSVLRYKFRTKYSNLLLVKAAVRKEKGIEQFWYNEAHYCTNISIKKVEQLLRAGDMVIEFRMWVDRVTNQYKDHGTCFRLAEKETLDLFEKKTKIL